MKSESLYYNAHLIASAIRISEHRNPHPPSISEICTLTGFSAEHAGFICSRMVDSGIITSVESQDGPRYFIKNHLGIEELPKEEPADKMHDELQKFRSRKDDLAKKVEEFQEKQKKKQQDLFARLNGELGIKK